ncbi:MAG TPA: aldose epimerase family protein [Aliidongia sp.]|uniref:aldose epimerase family protein n=1 Tax=Aliidongia sp. TaxID=1914230 RepID=UPI002DDD8A96|nr:aldose epimerase family protein [Aliidongia sp.]HEV2677274.1 aldose epimerase family protein [Aliidongia sp.]
MTAEGVLTRIVRAPFGRLADGTEIEAFRVTNAAGFAVTLLTYGATIQAVEAPDRHGMFADLVMGYASLQDYVDKPQFFGTIVGRYGNRIAGGRFTLDGQEYRLAQNSPPNALHGGVKGFDKAAWTVEEVLEGAEASLRLSYVSADGEEGYPGRLAVQVTYRVGADNALTIEYQATTDRPTVLNLTNHSYFNLGGEGSGDVLEHVALLDADGFTPIDEKLIPTGEIRPVAGTPFDFRTPKRIGDDVRDGRDLQIFYARGYDHNFVLRERQPGTPTPAARVVDPVSGRALEVLTDQPGVQFYTANFLLGTRVGKSGRLYRQGDAFCLETQHFPDSPNHPEFPSTVLRPGETFRSTTILRFSVK